MAAPLSRIYWPPTVSASTNKIRVRAKTFEDALATYEAAVGIATYYSPEELAAAVATAIKDAPRTGGGGATFGTDTGLGAACCAVSISTTTGRGTVTLAGVWGSETAHIDWIGPGAAYEACANLLGFKADMAEDADVSGVVAFASQWQASNLWIGGPAENDSGARAICTRKILDAASGPPALIHYTAEATEGAIKRQRIRLSYLPAYKVFTDFEYAVHPGEAIERFFGDVAALGRFRWWLDAVNAPDTYADLHLCAECASTGLERAQRHSPGLARYSLDLDCSAYVA